MEAYDSLTESPDNCGILSLDFLSLPSSGFQKKLVISRVCLKCDIVELAKLKTITLISDSLSTVSTSSVLMQIMTLSPLTPLVLRSA